MGKNKKKNKNNKVDKNEISENEIINKTNMIIQQLEKDKNHHFVSKKNKELIDHQISELKRFLDEEQYYLLDSKIKALESMTEEEKNEIAKDTQKQPKNKVNFSSFKEKIYEFDRWPFYSRIKKILNDYDGADRIKWISLVVVAYVLLIAISIIGILFIANVIPYTIESDETMIGAWLMTTLPLTILFFI